jgi:hypothetical protein
MIRFYDEIAATKLRERDIRDREATKRSAEETKNKMRAAFGSNEKVKASLKREGDEPNDRSPRACW